MERSVFDTWHWIKFFGDSEWIWFFLLICGVVLLVVHLLIGELDCCLHEFRGIATWDRLVEMCLSFWIWLNWATYFIIMHAIISRNRPSHAFWCFQNLSPNKICGFCQNREAWILWFTNKFPSKTSDPWISMRIYLYWSLYIMKYLSWLRFCRNPWYIWELTFL